ncbi:beta-propeller fold lactonase family protein [Nonomuraea guangzhouensis]|uniref:Beta-propeller fold lactonase family protein n=1 Tax=Nonomuraea guangzhouensis TaxID=1291555 RepID=A0ABW4GYB2_9ACTN|nr:beta-propeller fold lactonase family protein [Nonomuraea guangzhouensis]
MLTKLGLLSALIGLPLAMTPTVSPVEPTPRSVYVTSILEKNITRFAIQQDGSLKADAKLTETGKAPRGIEISPDARTVYVANGDDNTITTYRVGFDGRLVPLGSPTPTPEDPDDALVSPNGQRLYVISRRAATVTMFPIASDGTLTTSGTSFPVLGENPRGIAMTPDGRNLYVTTGDPVADIEPDVLVRFRVEDNGKLKRQPDTTPIGAAGGAMALTPDGKFLFVPCAARHEGEESHDVFAFSVGSEGALKPVPGSPFPAPDVPIAAAVTPDGRNLYVTDGGLIESETKLVSAYTIRDNGSLDHIADFNAGDSPVALGPSPDGRWLYVSNLNSSDVSAFRIKPGGELIQPGPPVPTGGKRPAFQSLAVQPNQGPQAVLSVSEPTGLEAGFDASTSPDPDGRVVRYDWTFGDGTVLKDGGPRPTHRFPAPGTYQVTVVVTDNEGCSTDLIFTGTSTQCNGSALARAQQAVTVTSG